ncbi:MAG: rhamnulokinase, partial [Verrucomicrobia bacterium]|nr:rhamnulokinase [Verrucomicrobiota bacterium]
LEKAATLLMIPDYLHWKLSGECRAEFTNASTTQCFDPSTGDWAWPLIERAGLPRHLFPRIERPGARLGPLRSDIALPCGLSAAEVILPATHDTGSAVAAVPTEHTGKATWAYISSGTWSLMGVEVNKPALSPGVLAENLTNEGGVDGTFRLLKNIMGMWLVQQCRKSFERQGRPLTYPELAALAQEAPPMRSLVDPDHPSFLSPADMPTAIRDRCRETGQPVPDTEGSLIRCALESLAMKYAQTLSALERATGQKISVVHIVGGGSQNELLNQWTANACGVPVLAGPVEATALGNLLIQVRSTGAIGSLTELREVVRNSTQPKLFLPARSGLPSQPPS